MQSTLRVIDVRILPLSPCAIVPHPHVYQHTLTRPPRNANAWSVTTSFLLNLLIPLRCTRGCMKDSLILFCCKSLRILHVLLRGITLAWKVGGPTVQLSYKAHKQHHFDGTFCNKAVKKVGRTVPPLQKVGGPDPPVLPPESYAYGLAIHTAYG
jgi:hypothetical protein